MKDKESGRNLDQAGIMSLYPTYCGDISIAKLW